MLVTKDGYQGIFIPATSAASDSQSPFDNMAWQMFVGLNWKEGDQKKGPKEGLSNIGERVWQTWPRVENVFGNGPVQASCSNPHKLPVFSIASNGSGTPSAKNEEYLQASTNLPLIDINGNWTLYERRLNATELQYLQAPGGQAAQTLITAAGQTNFVAAGNQVDFTPSGTNQVGPLGSMEIKASWRILDKKNGDNPSRYFTMKAMLEVPGDLVSGNQAICQPVTVGLVGMHIIAKNPKTGPKTNPDNGELLPQWIWATFEHVDNAPLAQAACDPTIKQCNNFGNASCGAATVQPKVRYSYFNPSQASSSTNVAPTASTSGPAFAWNNGQPYALGYTPPQAARCWQIYSLTQELNQQWQRSLHSARSVFANYMLVGTQWGASLEPTGPSPMPLNAVPGMLSNVTLETYIQNYAQPTATAGPGSCISCHSGATLLDGTTSANFSFLPGLASPTAARNIKR
ncbi:MAG TPA: hypothetical protein VF472_20065 [Burkholderiaceae bacterium]